MDLRMALEEYTEQGRSGAKATENEGRRLHEPVSWQRRRERAATRPRPRASDLVPARTSKRVARRAALSARFHSTGPESSCPRSRPRPGPVRPSHQGVGGPKFLTPRHAAPTRAYSIARRLSSGHDVTVVARDSRWCRGRVGTSRTARRAGARRGRRRPLAADPVRAAVLEAEAGAFVRRLHPRPRVWPPFRSVGPRHSGSPPAPHLIRATGIRKPQREAQAPCHNAAKVEAQDLPGASAA
jgi:hypothetical protein